MKKKPQKKASNSKAKEEKSDIDILNEFVVNRSFIERGDGNFFVPHYFGFKRSEILDEPKNSGLAFDLTHPQHAFFFDYHHHDSNSREVWAVHHYIGPTLTTPIRKKLITESSIVIKILFMKKFYEIMESFHLACLRNRSALADCICQYKKSGLIRN